MQSINIKVDPLSELMSKSFNSISLGKIKFDENGETKSSYMVYKIINRRFVSDTD